ncbi:uncharacterized protein LOC134857136 [Symsagittifera roscoffensis]|uniref:uncharacterized protein LOC134857136 n=1 Tax=Symsagittifera roscoffensis TaxID=84072 RepID=UPI00307B385D
MCCTVLSFVGYFGLLFLSAAWAESRRESLDFLLPDLRDHLGNRCSQQSDYFCLLRYWISSEVKSRTPQETDESEFNSLINTTFNSYNFFSFHLTDEEKGCCNQQIKIYLQNGQRNGLSPQEYYDKLTDFQTPNMSAVYVKARFDRDICANIINQIGFGRGTFKLIGDHRVGKDFFIHSPGNGGIYWVPRQGLNRLTFEWFKQKVICEGQPWLCEVGTSDISQELRLQGSET